MLLGGSASPSPLPPDMLRSILLALFLLTACAALLTWLHGSRPTESGISSSSTAVPHFLPGTQSSRTGDSTSSNVKDVHRVPLDAAPSPQEITREARTFSLEIFVYSSVSYGQEPRGNVAFEVGCIGNSTGSRMALTDGVTGADGKARVTVNANRVKEVPGNGRYLWVQATSPGYQQATRFVQVEDDANEASVRLRLNEGWTLRGLLRDADGNPCSGTVRAHMTGRPLTRGSNGGARDDGRFGVSGRPTETAEWVTATSDQPGHAGTAALRLDSWESAPQDLELRLSGSGILRGRVVDATGRGTAGLLLVAVAEEIVRVENNRALVKEVKEAFLLAGNGRSEASARTDGEGHFLIDGLCTGRFRLQAVQNDGSSEALTTDFLEADGEELEFQLDRTYLVVRARDAETTFLTIEPLRVMRFVTREWPSRPSILVTRKAGATPTFTTGRQRHRPVRSAPATELVYELEAATYLVSLLAPEGFTTPVEVDIAPGSGRSEVVLDLPSGEGSGVLDVEVIGPAGETDLGELRVQVRNPRGNVPLHERTLGYGPNPNRVKMDLPAGAYLLVVEGKHAKDSHHGTLLRATSYGRFEAPITVLAGQRESLQARLSEPSYLELHLEGSERPEDRRAVLDLGYVFEEGDPGLSLLARKARTTLLSNAGESIPVLFQTNEGPYGPYLVSQLALGTSAISQALPPGRFTLRVVLPGGRYAEREVVLKPGETCSATIDLGP